MQSRDAAGQAVEGRVALVAEDELVAPEHDLPDQFEEFVEDLHADPDGRWGVRGQWGRRGGTRDRHGRNWRFDDPGGLSPRGGRG
jgi:hypothetical protein